MPRLKSVSPRLPVADLRASIRFYSEVLGFAQRSVWPEHAPTFALLERDGVGVQLSAVESPDGLQEKATLSFDVDDATGLHAKLAGIAQIEWGPEVYWYGRREFAVRDPSGNLLIFSETTDDPVTCTGES